MATRAMNTVLDRLRRAASLREAGRLSDGDLLDCYVREHNEAAFEALVRRHGPMVLGVCRRILQNGHDAEDAFQATFLVLVRKAASVLPRDRVGGWLHGVAYHAALKARAVAVRRRAKERQVRTMPEPATVPDGLWHELPTLIALQLRRPPDK